MGLGLSRKIRSYRELSLDIIKRKNINIYKFLLLVGAFFKFISKINRRKNSRKYSENLDEINNFEYSITSQNNEDGLINYIFKKLKVYQPNFVEIGLDYYENNSLALLRKANKGLFIDGNDNKIIKACEDDLAKIAGQKPVVTKFKKSISNFKTRKKTNA